MSDETIPKPSAKSPAQTARFRAGAVIAIAVAVGLILWLALRNTGSSSSSSSSNATAVSFEQIKTLAASVGHPVFWVGPKAGYTYELTRTSNGSIYVRYLPPGVKVGVKQPYLTVATYPFAGAYAALQAVATQRDSTAVNVRHHGIAVSSSRDAASVHAAYPGVDYQVEVFDPTPGTATAMVTAGQLAAVGGLKETTQSAAPAAVSPAGLKALASSLGHPIYWVGARRSYTYEVTRTSNGRVFIRYLPPGVKVGAKPPYLTVATYPYPGAYAATKALTAGSNTVTFKLAGGGLAVLDTTHPQSIHLAFPSSDYQVEVFDPSPAAVRQIVSSGRVAAIG
jgi:hypothetical protein